MNEISYTHNDPRLTAEVFLSLIQRVWPGAYDKAKTQKALSKTLNVSAWAGERLIGNVRILSDGYFFGTIPEIFVIPMTSGHYNSSSILL